MVLEEVLMTFIKQTGNILTTLQRVVRMTGPASIEGVLVPAGTTTVYDQILGTNIRRPFLHVRYRASQGDDRRMKSWLTGSAGGALLVILMQWKLTSFQKDV